MERTGVTGGRLAEKIKKAIADGQLTNREYEEIMTEVYADDHVDKQEKNLLSQLQELLANKSVIRIPDE
jgi:pyrimidine operon attenuation protein/uracil phosphoribosyltransferase